MAFAITANFLLGTYQGSDSGGRPEPYPSPDRLYKACVAAAYNTFDFERQTDDRVLTDEQIKNALAWLEDNPPHSILLPRVIPPTSDAISYRDKGYLEKGKVQKNGEELASVPLDTIQGLQIYGNTDLSSGLIRELMWRDIPIVWCSGTGRMYGWATSSYGPNGEHRVDQHVASHEGRLGLAREFIIAKIHNQSVLLRRSESDNLVLPQLRQIEKQVANANRWQDVLGLEGEAASLYFSQFGHLVKTEKRVDWPWVARMRRPAPDELNSLLDFTYTLLLSDCVRALISCGLDPHAGFLHSSKRNKPALALDLMEEFRAPIADSVVQTVINNGEISVDGFSHVLESVRMTDKTRKTVIQAYERRMETEITHPIFKYKASWRRIIEIQARMILGYLDGTQPEYRGIRIR